MMIWHWRSHNYEIRNVWCDQHSSCQIKHSNKFLSKKREFWIFFKFEIPFLKCIGKNLLINLRLMLSKGIFVLIYMESMYLLRVIVSTMVTTMFHGWLFLS
jgi:hypothetical protein